MKRILLVAIIVITGIQSKAQLSFGGQIGVNLGMGQNGGGVGYTAITNDPKVGLALGAVAEIHIINKFSFRPELNFIQKGNKAGGYVIGTYYYGGDSKRTLNYFELPLNIVYKMGFGSSKNRFFFGAGPSFAAGLFGKDKNASGHDRTVKFDDDANANNADNVHLKRLDVGINVLAGYQFSMGLFGKISYTHGLTDIDPVSNGTYRNRGVCLTVGYMIGKK
ncbi:MAG: PorT family protein [Bacteroidetes bacterium]|nr:PorT family protein [Bacteroidota bacterium]